MLTIKVKPVPDYVWNTYWFCGADRMRPITKGTAKTLCDKYPLPVIGYETCVAVGRGNLAHRLYVLNVSGGYWVNGECPMDQWPEEFGITVKE